MLHICNVNTMGVSDRSAQKLRGQLPWSLLTEHLHKTEEARETLPRQDGKLCVLVLSLSVSLSSPVPATSNSPGFSDL